MIDYTALIGMINSVQKRAPDEIITNDKGVYLNRWHIVKNHGVQNVYIHQFLGSDDDRALHDHPWNSVSVILLGSYIEHLPNEQTLRRVGDVIMRDDKTPHRVELIGEECWTLFITGPKTKDWGFFCPEGWTKWDQFEEQGGCNE